jgi:hypothetical protein
MTKCEGELDEYDKKDTTEYYWWGNVNEVEMDRESAIEYSQEFGNAETITGAIAGIVTTYATESRIVSVSVACVAAGLTLYYANKIGAAAKAGSIRIESTHYYFDSEDSTYVVYDKDGNIIFESGYCGN